MTFAPVIIDHYENKTGDWAIIHGVIKIGPGSRIMTSKINGPLSIGYNSQLGPGATAGKYVGINDNCYFPRGEIGAFCSIGSRVAINPFNHPLNWLSIHEFQFNPRSWDFMPEYNSFERLERTADMFHYARIGNDVWMAHNVSVLAGADVGDGAVIGAGSVVAASVPPYAIVAGAPAKILRYRFDEKTIERLLRVRWWDFDLADLSGLDFRDVAGCLSRLEDLRAQRAEMPDR